MAEINSDILKEKTSEKALSFTVQPDQIRTLSQQYSSSSSTSSSGSSSISTSSSSINSSSSLSLVRRLTTVTIMCNRRVCFQ